MDGGGAGAFFDQTLGLDSGEITDFVSARYAQLTMLMEWGVMPHQYDAAPRHTRIEMWKFYTWKLEREESLRRKAAMEAKHPTAPREGTR